MLEVVNIFLLWEHYLRSQTSNSLDKLLHKLHLNLVLLKALFKHDTRLIKELIGDAQIPMYIRHVLADIEFLAIQLPFEKLSKFLLKELHLVRVLELVMVTGQLSISHDSLHEVLYKDRHLGVATELGIETLGVSSVPRIQSILEGVVSILINLILAYLIWNWLSICSRLALIIAYINHLLLMLDWALLWCLLCASWGGTRSFLIPCVHSSEQGIPV